MPKTGAEQLAAAFPGATVPRLPQSGHYPHEDQPEVVIAAIERLIETSSVTPAN